MAVTVILVRHGKAEKGGWDKPDAARELKPEGVAALKAAYPTTFGLVTAGAPEKVEVWRSPAVRACQTADAIIEALGETPVEITDHECLFEQDGEEFLTELDARLAARDEGVVICVGHVPFMEDTAHYLTGVDLPFSTGAACAVELSGTARHDPNTYRVAGRLLWFVQGPRA